MVLLALKYHLLSEVLPDHSKKRYHNLPCPLTTAICVTHMVHTAFYQKKEISLNNVFYLYWGGYFLSKSFKPRIQIFSFYLTKLHETKIIAKEGFIEDYCNRGEKGNSISKKQNAGSFLGSGVMTRWEVVGRWATLSTASYPRVCQCFPL